MTSHPSAGATTPVDWIDEAARKHPDRPALIFAEGAATYAQLFDAIDARRRSLPTGHGEGAIVDVPVRSDFASIVELFAVQAAGGCPRPFADRPSAGGGGSSDGAVLCISTSGTSGGPKVVPLTMDNLGASVSSSKERLGTTDADRWLVPLPMHHIGGLSVLYRVFEAGAIAVVHGFSEGLVDLIHRTDPTISSMVPTMVRRLMASFPDALATIDAVLTGGGPSTASLINDAERAGARLLPTYGMTETSSQIATVAPGSDPIGVGRPLDGFDVAIGPNGRIVVDGPAVFGGYLGEPERSGAFTTADLGQFDAEGNLIVLGRADDVAVTGGENVLLPHVEDTIRRVVGVDDVAVVAVPDDEWGQAVCAIVVGVNTQAMAEVVRDGLEPHEVPRRWLQADSIPLLGNGKPDVLAIESMFTAQ